MNDKYIIANDNELLYLIKEGNEEALELMYKKYEPMIMARVKKFNFDSSLEEDYFQEGRLMLHKAMRTYDTNSNKTFNKYFDLILTNQLITLYRKNNRYKMTTFLVDNEVADVQDSLKEELDNIDFSHLKLSKLEKEIYKMRFLRNYKVIDICQALNVTEKTVYNTIRRVKVKLEDLK